MIAREHDVNANMVFRWRQQYQDGAFDPCRSKHNAPASRGDRSANRIATTNVAAATTSFRNPDRSRDGDGLCLFCKRLEQGRFVWPQATSGSVSLTVAQLSMLLGGIDWRRPIRNP